MPIVRSLGLCYMFGPVIVVDEGEIESQLLAPSDCDGMFPSHQDWYALVERVDLFYECLSPTEIETANERQRERLKQRQERRVTEAPAPLPCKGYVYLLKGGGYYKIGLSKDINRRMEELSPKLPFATELICTIATRDMHKLETALHELYAAKRVNGEWFELDEADVVLFKEFADG